MKIKFVILIPIYNEAENLLYLIKKIKKLLEIKKIENYALSFKCCFINDGSNDDTEKILETVTDPKITFLSWPLNQGKSHALNHGIKSNPNADFYIFMDGDGQDDAEEVPFMISEMLKNNLDVISGFRKERKDKFLKKFVSSLYNFLVSKLFNKKIMDINTGLKISHKKVFEKITLYGNNHRIFILLALLNGFKFNEVPVKSHSRYKGKSKYNLLRIDGLITIINFYIIFKTKENPSLFFNKIAFYIFIFSIILIIYFSLNQLLYLLALSNQPVSIRPLILFSLTGLIVSLIIFSIGFIAEYILYLSKKRD